MLYLSSSCFAGKNIDEIIASSVEAGVHNIELSNGEKEIPNVLNRLLKFKRKHKLNFLVHNYFPPPAYAFVLNLASQDKIILRKSVEHCKRAIVLASRIECPVYSVHAGFRTNPAPSELGKKIDINGIAPYDIAYSTMVDSLKKLCAFAHKFKVKIAVENHEISKANLINGKNELLLMCAADEFMRLFSDVSSPDLQILVDLGHLNVSATTLGFDKFEFIEKLKNRIALFHASHNNGQKDEHKPVTEKSWFWPIIRKFKNIDCVVESHNLDVKSIERINSLFSKLQ
ncbi:MAG: sugar phosphate isomerase/epimerase family protein [Parcubacteria group bacterium]